MRLEISCRDRVGITHDTLAVLSSRKIDVRAVDMVANHIYLDVPQLSRARLLEISDELQALPGIIEFCETDMLPSERRRAQLHAVLSALPEPVFAIDLDGIIVLANSKAAHICGVIVPEDLRGQHLSKYFSSELVADIIRLKFSFSDREITIGGSTYMMRASQINLTASGENENVGGAVILQPLERLGSMLSALQKHGEAGFDTIIGDSKLMHTTKKRALRLATVDAPLLILGETGTGKELFARACHQSSQRAAKSFLALNCAALPESLAESELFGYAAGAFTSAVKGGKPGLLELSDEGTLFLDEIGELTPHLQAKLLRFLQDGSFRRIGGASEIQVNVRIIAATNRDIESMSEHGSFRPDLFFRLNVLNLHTPSLEERRDDIPQLAHFFVDRAAARIGRVAPLLTDNAVKALVARDWPGNVRELENILFRSVSLHDGPVLDVQDISFDKSSAVSTEISLSDELNGAPLHNYQHAIESFERILFTKLFTDFPSSRKLAARLGISHTTAARKLHKYGLTSSPR